MSSAVRKTLLICLLLVLVGAALLVLIYLTQPGAERESAVRETAMLVDVTHAEAGDFRPVIRAMGQVRPAQEITLRSRVGGEIMAHSDDFEPGGVVERGETLVRLNAEDHENVVEQRRGELEQAIADLEIERGEQAAAEAEYRQFDRELPPERRALVLREPQLRAAEAQVASARVALAQAELDLARTEIEAPFDAHVLSREVDAGSQVSPGDALGRLVGVETYWIEATVPLSQLPWLDIPADGENGSPVAVRNRSAWPAGVSRTGRLYRLIGELEGETRLARVLVAVDDPLAREGDSDATPPLMLGEYVQCRIEGIEIRDVVRLERDYIRADDSVWLMVDNRLVIRPVDIVFRDDTYAYIREGLDVDDEVVTTRLATVEEGVRLRVEDSNGMEAPAP